MNTKTPKVSIVILNYNTEDYTICALESMKDTDYDNYEIILIENGSEENSRIKLRKFLEKFELKDRIIYREVSPNQGFSGGCNIGLYEALKNNPDYVLFLSNDIKIIQNDWLKNFIETVRCDKNIGIAGCKLVYSDGKLQHAGGEINFFKPHFTAHIGIQDNPDKEDYNKLREVDFVTGAAMLVKSEVIKKIGGFDEIFSPAYYEDADFCVRAKRSGFIIVYAPNIKIIHYESLTTKKVTSSYFTYLGTRNKILFCLLNMPIKYFPIRAVYEFFSMIKWILKGQGKSYFKAVFWNIKNLNLIIKKRNERKYPE